MKLSNAKSIIVNRYITFLFSLLLFQLTCMAQWIPINPGAGGQVQDVVGDPGTPGTLYLASDMEGVYKSTDNGESWHITGQLLHNRVYAVTVAPDDPNRLYVGTLFGLHISDDGGETYEFVGPTRNKTIGSVAVDPGHTEVVLAGNGWRDDYDFATHLGEKTSGSGVIYRSEDGGQSWSEIVFAEGNNADRNIWNFCFDQTTTAHVFMGSSIGIFESTDGGLTWEEFEGPSGVSANRGIALSPNGEVLYGTFGTNGKVFATQVTEPNWHEVMNGDGVQMKNLKYWYPEVDPRSDGNNHKLLIGMEGQREGLFEGTFEWDNGVLKSYSWSRVWHDDGDWDRGWDYATPNARYAHYTPKGWDRALWSTTNQTIYQAEPDGNGYQWNNKYCTPNYDFQVPAWGTTFPTYSGRGTESTYTYDIAVHENYVIQGQGDNGFMESWDYGVSWSNMQHRQDGINLSDVQAVDIADAWGTPVVVAQATSGYGGNAKDGRLFVKKLDEHSPNDQWLHLGAGPSRLLGIGSGILRDIAVSPANPAKVYMFSTGNGMYMIEDIGRTLEGYETGNPVNATKISNAGLSGVLSAKKISPHPTNEDIVFFNSSSGTGGVYKGVRVDDDWTWTKIYNGYGWDSEVHSWEHNGQVYLMYHGFASGEQGDGDHTVVALSLDEGQTWEIVFNKEMAKSLRSVPWYEAWSDIYTFRTKGGPAAFGNTMIVNYYHHGYQLGYGLFKGTIGDDGSISWEDWTGDLHFPGPTSAIFAETNNQIDFYVSTAGAGAWKRYHSIAPDAPAKPEVPEGLGATPVSDTEIELEWTDVSTHETGFRIERRTSGAEFEIVGQVGKNQTSFVDFGLLDNTAYEYRVFAFNKGGKSEYTSVTLVTTLDGRGEPCENPNLISNGDFESGQTGWELYNNGAAASSASIVEDGELGDGQAVKINISSIHSGDSDIQYFFAFDVLKKGAYTFSFRAMSSGSKTIRAAVLLNEGPWTSFLSENLTITAEPQMFGPYAFSMGETATNVRVDFFLGNDTEDIWIDDVMVVSTERCVFYPVESITIMGCQDNLNIGETLTLTAEILPLDASDPSVEWVSSDEEIASVNEYGIVEAIAAGTVTISLYSTSSGLNQECQVTVPEPEPVEPILGMDLNNPGINIHPNPSNGSLTIHSKTALNVNHIKIFDLLGAEVDAIVRESPKGIVVSELMEGIYFLVINSLESTISQKVIVR